MNENFGPTEQAGERVATSVARPTFLESMMQRRQELEALRLQQRRSQAQQIPSHSLSPVDHLRLGEEPCVHFNRGLLELTGNVNEAMLLSQVLYWTRRPPSRPGSGAQLPRARALLDGVYWVSKTYLGFSQETGLSCAQTKRAIYSLRRKGFILTKVASYQGRRALYVRLGEEIHNRCSTHQLSEGGCAFMQGLSQSREAFRQRSSYPRCFTGLVLAAMVDVALESPTGGNCGSAKRMLISPLKREWKYVKYAAR